MKNIEQYVQDLVIIISSQNREIRTLNDEVINQQRRLEYQRQEKLDNPKIKKLDYMLVSRLKQLEENFEKIRTRTTQEIDQSSEASIAWKNTN